MKKYVFSLIGLLLSITLFACADSNDNVEQLVVGEIQKSQLLEQYELFSDNYKRFELSAAHTSQIEQWPGNLKIDVYFGTWCHDSEREVPRLLKALQNFKHVNMNLIALGYDKNDPQGRAKKVGIKYTPTFIVYLTGQEIGRIIERPKNSLVDDITTMIAQSNLNAG
ncbi:MAG: thioredoxin family protein [Alteromonadaceae bacterium]|nr:thioredoxin family protein [Alteromonadaceae bacterium]